MLKQMPPLPRYGSGDQSEVSWTHVCFALCSFEVAQALRLVAGHPAFQANPAALEAFAKVLASPPEQAIPTPQQSVCDPKVPPVESHALTETVVEVESQSQTLAEAPCDPKPMPEPPAKLVVKGGILPGPKEPLDSHPDNVRAFLKRHHMISDGSKDASTATGSEEHPANKDAGTDHVTAEPVAAEALTVSSSQPQETHTEPDTVPALLTQKTWIWGETNPDEVDIDMEEIGEMLDRCGISADDEPTPVPPPQDPTPAAVSLDPITPLPVPNEPVPEPVAESFPDAQPRFLASQTADSLDQQQASVAEVPAAEASLVPSQVAEVPQQVAGDPGHVAESLKRLSTVDLENGCRPPMSLEAKVPDTHQTVCLVTTAEA